VITLSGNQATIQRIFAKNGRIQRNDRATTHGAARATPHSSEVYRMNGKRGDLVYAKACRVRKTEEHRVLRHGYEILELVAFIEKRKQ